MTDRIKTLLIKYREIIVYVLVGLMTTAVSWIASYLLKLFLDDQIVWQNAVINDPSGGGRESSDALLIAEVTYHE